MNVFKSEPFNNSQFWRFPFGVQALLFTVAGILGFLLLLDRAFVQYRSLPPAPPFPSVSHPVDLLSRGLEIAIAENCIPFLSSKNDLLSSVSLTPLDFFSHSSPFLPTSFHQLMSSSRD